ncbi:DsbA family protein [Paenarthrobacter sp. NPDC058040]|uniref:DsbA family protein n=1 Tax=unclassified Paenarthrobacter TaxID=2634190 RepID=UPI0036DC0D70
MSAAVTGRGVRIAIWILLAAVLGAGAIYFAVLTSSKPAPLTSTEAQLVRDDSHRVTSPPVEKAQLVEFLDFECESCRAAELLLAELKEEYGDRITFIHRYYPLPGHRNSGTAAVAVEAAAQQGKYQEMAAKLFEMQPYWGEATASQAGLFRTYAQELGLDMTRYDAALSDQAVKDRISRDVADGRALGVAGTPTFFLSGKKLALDTEEQFRQLLDEAIQG